jgi:hypothetical protein
MRERFEHDLQQCHPYTLAMWKSRPLKQRLSEWLVTPFRSEL